MQTPPFFRKRRARALAPLIITGLAWTVVLLSEGRAGITAGDVTRFSPDTGQPIFPAGNLNVFKQYVLAVEVSERIGDSVSIPLLGTFGGEISAGVKAALGLEVGLCFGGNADFDLAFKPTITVPDRYPTEFPIRLVVEEGLRPDSHFTTTFPPLGKAYADLIFEMGANLGAEACVFGCVGFAFAFDTCDPAIPSVGGFRMFKESVRCDPAIDAEAYCSVELASFNRADDNTFRMLNVTANNRFEFLNKPYLEFAPSTGIGSVKTFGVLEALNLLQVSGINRLSDGTQVKVSSTGTLPGGLSSARTYYVTQLAPGPGGVEFQLAGRAGGSGIDLTSPGTGVHTLSLVETNKPDAPTFGKYGTIAINAPTVGTDSRVVEGDESERSWIAESLGDQLVIVSPPGFRNGNKVRLASVGRLPRGLSRGCVYFVTNASADGLRIQLATSYGGPAVDFLDGGVGTHRIVRHADFNTAGTLTSSGAEDMMAVDIDVATLVSDILLPPTFPSLSDSGSIGPLGWDYTMASLTLGPAVQLQTDFEMSWDLVVTDILFHKPGTLVPAPVIVEGVEITSGSYRAAFPARVVHLTNSGPHPLPGIALIDMDPVAVTIIYTLAPMLKTTVSAPFLGRVKYEALAAGASISRVGELRFGPLIEGEHVFKAGEFTVYDGDPSPVESTGPRSEYELNQDLARYDLLLVDTASDSVPASGCALVVVYKVVNDLHLRIFDAVGEMAQDGPASGILSPTGFAELRQLLDPWPLGDLGESEGGKVLSSATRVAGNQPGVIHLTLKAEGPPTFLYVPRIFQVREFRGVGTYWDQIDRSLVAEPFSNWIEKILLLDDPNNPNADDSYPGELGVSSDATIDVTPGIELNVAKEIASLQVGQNGWLNIYVNVNSANDEAAGLTVNGGVVNNEGTIEISGTANGGFMRLDRPNASLSGSGDLRLTAGTFLKGAQDSAEPITFSNANTISGLGFAMDRYGIGAGATITNMGAFTARGGSDDNGDKLFTSADLFINHGTLSAEAGTLQARGARLENRAAGSEGGGGVVRAASDQGAVFVQFNEVEQAGYFEASAGGYIGISPAESDPALWTGGRGLRTWKPGDPLPQGSGAFLATGPESRINFFNTRMSGGFVATSDGGTVTTTASRFDGTVFQVGDFNAAGIDPGSGKLVIQGTLTDVYLTNYGTVEISGDTEFVDSQLLANNGTLSVDTGRTLQIREIIGRTEDPAAPEVAQRHPGSANATGELLVGGTWDIAGTLLIDGAAFKGIGANTMRSRTSFGSRKDGANPDPVLQVEDDLTGVLSLGDPAHVILRGPAAAFPALDTLVDNGGTLELRGGADFPGGGTGAATVGNLVNRGAILLDQDSVLSVGGSYIQAGPDSRTRVLNGGQLVSATRNYQIIGGSLTADNGASLLGLAGNGFSEGTILRVESPLIDTNETDPFTGQDISVQERVAITLGSAVALQQIGAGVEVTLHGGAVDFPALTNHLSDVFGKLTVSGDGYENAADPSFGILSNSGTVEIQGRGSRMEAAAYVQDAFGASTRIGSGARLTSPDITLFDGELIVDISARPREEQFGQIQSARVDFRDRLVVDFVADVAASMPDIGDTWPIIKPDNNSRIQGIGTVTFRHGNGALPADWLPVGSHLEAIRLNPRELANGEVISGLGVQIVPDGGFVEYDDWAVARGMDRSPFAFLSDPMQDINGDGVANIYDFLFGYNDGNGLFPGNQSSRLVTAGEGGAYYELSYDRPVGTGAAFNPYVSEDLVAWYPAAMIITGIVDLADGSNQQRVFLKSTFPLPDRPVFFRVDGSLNKIDHGLVGEKPIHFFGGSPLNNLTPEDLIQDNVVPGYRVVPGRELYFRTTGHGEGSIRAYVTSGLPDGTGAGEYLYGGFSALGRAAVFQGLLAVGETGLLKVTFVEVPPVTAADFSFTVWKENNVTANGFSTSDYAQPYGFTIERLVGYAGQ